jgi:hypothetical protein
MRIKVMLRSAGRNAWKGLLEPTGRPKIIPGFAIGHQ